MKTQLHSKKKTEIYSTSGFKDTLASPVFYPVIVVALVLGVTSIFGFVQNPLKLKAVVNVIHQKVAETEVVNDPFKEGSYTFAKPESQSTPKLVFKQSAKTHELFSNTSHIDEKTTEKIAIEGSVERIAFNYDVTSESFWRDLDSSSLETFTEEMKRQDNQALTIGVPMERENQQRFSEEFDVRDKSIYALSIIK